MNYTGSAPVRQPEPELPELVQPAGSGPERTPQGGEHTIASLRLLWGHRRLLARVVIYGLFASLLIVLLIPNRYQSTARLMPPDNNQSGGLAMAAAALTSSAGDLGNMASQMLGIKSNSDIFAGILSSRTVQDKLIEQFDLRRIYSDRRMEDARTDLAEHTGVSVDRKSQIITSTSSARRERIFLEERLKSVSQDLESAEKEFSQFSSKNTALDIKEQGKAMVGAAATLQGQYIAAQSELEGLRQIYSDNNVRVRSVRARMDELKHQLEKLGGKGESMTDASSQPGDSLYPSIRKLPLLGVTYADLYRRTKIQETVLETLTKEYEMAKVQEAKEIPTVKVLDPANVPDKKSFPPRTLMVLFGTALAFAVGSGWVLGKTRWDRTDPSDSRKAFAQEVIATAAAELPWLSRNGSGVHSAGKTVWSWTRRRKYQDDSEKAE